MGVYDYFPELKFKVQKLKRQTIGRVNQETEEQWQQEMRNSAAANQFADSVIETWFSSVEAKGCQNLNPDANGGIMYYYNLRVYTNGVGFELIGRYTKEGKRDTEGDLGVAFSAINMRDITNEVKRETLHAMIMEKLAQLPFLKIEHGKIYYNSKFVNENIKQDW